MLNIVENSDVMEFIKNVEDERMQKLLHSMHFDYMQYTHIGTPEQCQRYKDWCDLKPSDYMRMLDNCVTALKDELECKERYYQKKIKELEQGKKRGKKED